VKSSVEVLSPTRVRLDVEVAYSELESHVAVAYKKVAAQVNIPGFRKGKIPAAMIDQRVGRGAVIDEAINSALPEFYGQAAREHEPAGRSIGRQRYHPDCTTDRLSSLPWRDHGTARNRSSRP
jgi:trigger factor